MLLLTIRLMERKKRRESILVVTGILVDLWLTHILILC